jgi:transcriptional regulator with XRE-family HTH domain
VNRIAEIRAKQGLTLRELAQQSGVDANTINKIENGRRRPQRNTAHKIANALGVPVEDLGGVANWRARYLEQEAEHAGHLVETAARVRETLEAGELVYTARFLEILDEGLRNLSESLHEAHRIETGEKPAAEKSIDDKLNELLREYEAKTA